MASVAITVGLRPIVRVAGVVPLPGDAVTNSGDPDVLVVNDTAPPVDEVRLTVCVAGVAPLENANVRFDVESASVCAAPTTSVTGIFVTLFAAPVTTIVTVPEYVPWARLAPLAATVTVPGVVPVELAILSQPTPVCVVALAVNDNPGVDEVTFKV